MKNEEMLKKVQQKYIDYTQEGVQNSNYSKIIDKSKSTMMR